MVSNIGNFTCRVQVVSRIFCRDGQYSEKHFVEPIHYPKWAESVDGDAVYIDAAAHMISADAGGERPREIFPRMLSPQWSWTISKMKLPLNE